MVSTRHINAEWYFNRDVECIRRFFRRRFNYESAVYPRFSKTLVENEEDEGFRLDVVVSASGFGGKEMKVLDEYLESKLGEDAAESSDLESSELEENENGSDPEDDGDDPPRFRQVRSAAQDYAIRQERRGILDTPLSEDSEDEGAQDLSTEIPVASLSIKDKTDDDQIHGTIHSKASIGSGVAASVNSHGTDDVPQDGPKTSSSVLRSLVSSALEKEHRQNAKHHKRRTMKVGRAKGHKGKQNLQVKVDSSGVWD
ncbi:unnamed protein product [Rhizoctonia solani]|uniref:Uncharacterized protein n=1 Tax=Rhizoctonia solani TaxID=456999 RepID=A0A8H3E0T1_9AGAM|nr:unnamed protein product [Rhizoctonia solani]